MRITKKNIKRKQQVLPEYSGDIKDEISIIQVDLHCVAESWNETRSKETLAAATCIYKVPHTGCQLLNSKQVKKSYYIA